MQACDRIISGLVVQTVVRVTRLAGCKQLFSSDFRSDGQDSRWKQKITHL